MAIKVVATRLGYYNHKRQKEGVAFVIRNEGEFSKLWMKKVEEVSDAFAPKLDDEMAAEIAMGLATKEGVKKSRKGKKVEDASKDSEVI